MCSLLYLTCHACMYSTQVRGPKVIVRWFSHDVSDLEFVLSLIEAQDMDDHDVSKGHVTLTCLSCDVMWCHVTFYTVSDLGDSLCTPAVAVNHCHYSIWVESVWWCTVWSRWESTTRKSGRPHHGSGQGEEGSGCGTIELVWCVLVFLYNKSLK